MLTDRDCGVSGMKMSERLGDVRKTITGFLTMAIFVAVIFFAGIWYAGRNGEPKITTTTILNQLQEANELTTMEYHYTKVGEFENSLNINGWDIPLTRKSFLLTYQGELKAGVDMSKAKVDIKDHVITITLPEIEILSNAIDESSIEVYDESRNIFNPIKIEDYTTFATKQKQMVEEEAIENGIYSQAATKAQDAITKLLNLIPDVAQNYTVQVKFETAEEEHKEDSKDEPTEKQEEPSKKKDKETTQDSQKEPTKEPDRNESEEVGSEI